MDGTCNSCTQERRISDLEDRVTELEAALKDALELAEEGWGYASEYFKDKWSFGDRLSELSGKLKRSLKRRYNDG